MNTAHRWFALWIKVPWVLFQTWSQPLPFTSTWILWASVSLPMKGKGRQWMLRGPDARWDHPQISSYTLLWRLWWPCVGWALRHSFHQPPVSSEPATGAHAEGTWVYTNLGVGGWTENPGSVFPKQSCKVWSCWSSVSLLVRWVR